MLFDQWQFNAVLILIVIAGCIVDFVHGKLYRECIGTDNNQKFVASLDNCAKYIYCDGNNSFEGECLDDNYFNVFEGNCGERAAVVCRIGEQLAVGSTQISKGSQGSQGSPGSVGSLGSVSQWEEGRVDGNTNFYNNINNKYTNNNNNWHSFTSQWESQEQQQQQQQQQAKQQQQVYLGLASGAIDSAPVTGLALNAIDMGNTGAVAVAIDGNQPPQCPIRYGLSNVFYLPNTQSCASYYTCYNGIAIPMICPRHTYFSKETSRCERQENFYCPLYRPVRLICNRGVYDYIPHPRNCGYYYLCSNGYLMIFQCPLQYLWHYERRSCVHRSQAKCFTSAVAEAMLS